MFGVRMGPTGEEGTNHWRDTDQYDTAKPTSPEEVICTVGTGESTDGRKQLLADGDAEELRLRVGGGEVGECEAGHGDDVPSFVSVPREGIRGAGRAWNETTTARRISGAGKETRRV